MHTQRPNISLRQIAIAAAIAVVASFAIYYVFDVLPQSVRLGDSGLTEVEIKSRLEKNLQNVSGDASAQTVDVNFDGYVISWQRTINEPSCEDPDSWYSRTVTIDLRNLETRPDRVERYTRDGRVMLIWKYDRDYEELLQRMNDKRDETLARIRSGGSSGANAAAQLSEVLTDEFGKELESGSTVRPN